MPQLDSRVAIVTGAGSGIGRAITLGLAAEGASVCVADLVGDRAETVAAEVEAAGPGAMAYQVDVSDSAAVDRMVSAVTSHFGTLDILVNNAGTLAYAPVVDMTDEQWDRVVAVNLRGTFVCSRAALRHMISRRRGRIVNTASGRGIHGSPGAAVYGATKAAVINITRALAVEVAPFGITVNAISPGPTDTPFWRSGRSADQVEAARQAGRVGEAGDLVPAVVFLCSEAGRAISGVTIDREVFVSDLGER
jgi:NAD(P)-dependent dehydrogenase (short-subunit alcohol dehydrogenase family)